MTIKLNVEIKCSAWESSPLTEEERREVEQKWRDQIEMAITGRWVMVNGRTVLLDGFSVEVAG